MLVGGPRWVSLYPGDLCILGQCVRNAGMIAANGTIDPGRGPHGKPAMVPFKPRDPAAAQASHQV